MLNNGTQRRVLPRAQSEEIEILNINKFNFFVWESNPQPIVFVLCDPAPQNIICVSKLNLGLTKISQGSPQPCLHYYMRKLPK